MRSRLIPRYCGTPVQRKKNRWLLQSKMSCRNQMFQLMQPTNSFRCGNFLTEVFVVETEFDHHRNRNLVCISRRRRRDSLKF